MEKIFHVVPGKGSFKIVDDYGTVFGWYLDKEDADYYCDILNDKAASLKTGKP